MAAIISQGKAWETLKPVLNTVASDEGNGKLVCQQYMTEETTDDAYEDDLEVSGFGLMSEKPQGADAESSDLTNGAITRYKLRTFAMVVDIASETLGDTKYTKQYLKIPERLRRAYHKTLETDCANIFNRALDANYTNGSGVSLCSTAQTLPAGGTFSNLLATPAAPSHQSLIDLRTLAASMPDYDGIPEGQRCKAIMSGTTLAPILEQIVSSRGEYGTANRQDGYFNGKGIKVIENVYLTSTTNYFGITDAEDSLKLFRNKKLKTADWVEERPDIHCFKASARWIPGWTNARGVVASAS